MRPPVSSFLFCVMCSAVSVQTHAPRYDVEMPAPAPMNGQQPRISNLQLLHPMHIGLGSPDEPFSNIPSEAFTLDEKTVSKRTIKKDLGNQGVQSNPYLAAATPRTPISALVGDGLEDTSDTLEWFNISDYEDTKDVNDTDSDAPTVYFNTQTDNESNKDHEPEVDWLWNLPSKFTEFTQTDEEQNLKPIEKTIVGEIIDLVENGLDTKPNPRSEDQQHVTNPTKVKNNPIVNIIGLLSEAFVLIKHVIRTLINGESTTNYQIEKEMGLLTNVLKLLVTGTEGSLYGTTHSKEKTKALPDDFLNGGSNLESNPEPTHQQQITRTKLPTSLFDKEIIDLLENELAKEYDKNMTFFTNRVTGNGSPQSNKESTGKPKEIPNRGSNSVQKQTVYDIFGTALKPEYEPLTPFVDRAPQSKKEMQDFYYVYKKRDSDKGHNDLPAVVIEINDGGPVSPAVMGYGCAGSTCHTGQVNSQHQHSYGTGELTRRPRSRNKRRNWSVVGTDQEKNGKPTLVV